MQLTRFTEKGHHMALVRSLYVLCTNTEKIICKRKNEIFCIKICALRMVLLSGSGLKSIDLDLYAY